MKKFFTFFVAVLFAGSMMAGTAEMKYAGSTTNMSGDANNAATVGLDATLFNVQSVKNDASNHIGLNKAGDIRLYGNASGNVNALVVTITGSTITSIALDIKQKADYTVTAGGDPITEKDGTFEINAASFTIKNVTKGTTQLQLNKITINYANEGELAMPTIAPSDGNFVGSVEVSISAVEGAEIYYTLDETDPTKESTKYEAPFTLTATTTVKAVAAKEDKVSEVAAKKYTLVELISVEEALKIGNDLDSMKSTEAKYMVEGYVYDAEEFNLSYNTQTWYMADDAENTKEQVFQAYGCLPLEGNDTLQVLNGDKVQVMGNIKRYYNATEKKFVIEIEKGVATFISKVEGDHTVDRSVHQVTVEEALEIGNKLADGKVSPREYEITGYVSHIHTFYSGDFKNETLWISDDPNSTAASSADKAFEIYRGKPNTEAEVGQGAKVTIVCKIKNYKGTIENDGSNVPFEVVEASTYVPDTLTVAQAVEIASNLENDKLAPTYSVVKGFVQEVTNAYSSKYNNATFKMSQFENAAEGPFTAYQASILKADSNNVVKGASGAYVLVTGYLTKHSSAPQIAAGAKTEFTEAPKIDTLKVTVAGAMEAGQALADNALSEEYYLVTGYVINPTEMDDEEETTQDFYLADDKEAEGLFKAYRAKIEYPGVAAGDKVALFGNIKKNVHDEKVTIQMEYAVVTVIEKAQGIENIVLTEKAQKVVVDGVIYIVRDNKMFNLQGVQVR